MKKKVLASLLAGCMVLGSLTACGGGEEAADTTAEPSQEASAEESEEAAEELDIELTTQDAQKDTSRLLQFIEI